MPKFSDDVHTRHPPSLFPYLINKSSAKANRKKVLKSLASGGLAGASEILSFYPMEYAKTQLQLDGKGGDKKFKGMIDCLTKTIRTNGFFGIYRGMKILLIGTIPKSAVRFAGYEFWRINLLNLTKRDRLTIPQNLICGLLAGSGEAILVVTPMETIKTRMINDMRLEKPRYKGLFHGIRSIIKEEGYSGCYKGLSATLLKCSFQQAMMFGVYHSCVNWYKTNNKTEKVPFYIFQLFGGISSFITVLTNAPFDMVKTRMQSLNAAKLYKSTYDCFSQIYHQEGFKAFYKGAVPRIFRSCHGMTFLFYETYMKLLSNI